MQAAAQVIGQQLVVLDVGNERDLEPAFATFVPRGAGCAACRCRRVLDSYREQLVALAARHHCRQAIPRATPSWPVA